jgi:transcriptional regulator with XRE-family HTH domain
MPTYPWEIAQLNWRAMVDEAIRRRKAEKMTQRDHAALASVSVPTIVAFDRGETTLTLAKAFDILRVVGLVDEPSKEGAQETFVQQAFARWRELTAKLPEDSPGRFPHGWYRIDYTLEGDLKDIELHQFSDIMRQSVVRHTGWPLFLFLTRPELAPQEIDGVIECWVKPEDNGVARHLGDAAHCDFWRAAPTGRAFAIRGYQEDGEETFPPRTVFDTTLPTWRLGEALLHADNLANLIAVDPKKTNVRLRAHYTGLNGRVLRSWANPLADFGIEGGASRSDEAVLEAVVPVKDITKTGLAKHLHPLIASLFERFGVTGLTVDRVQAELDRMMKNNFSSVRS